MVSNIDDYDIEAICAADGAGIAEHGNHTLVELSLAGHLSKLGSERLGAGFSVFWCTGT